VEQQSRYRVEAGATCIDVRISRLEQIFDNRDPAPFRERDLDPELVEYLLGAGEDLASVDPIRIVFWLEMPCRPREIEQAFHAHFEYALERLRRTRGARRRTGQVALVIGILLVIGLISLSQLVGASVPGSLGVGLKEGLVISSWVVLWRPVEILIYDWIPVRHERKIITRIFEAPIEVRSGNVPDGSTHPAAPAPGGKSG